LNSVYLGWVFVSLLASSVVRGQESPLAEEVKSGAGESGCLACHAGIESIREMDSGMLQQIVAWGAQQGDPAGCVVCHGGDPAASDKQAAHQGDEFYPDPGSPWVNDKTCGQCHPNQVRVQWHSLMMTEAGKIQGVCWAFGSLHQDFGATSGYDHLWANYDVENPTDPTTRLGTPIYRQYMQRHGP
jgi:hypothetical protein